MSTKLVVVIEVEEDGRASKVTCNGEEVEVEEFTERSWTIFPHLDEEEDIAYNLILVEAIV